MGRKRTNKLTPSDSQTPAAAHPLYVWRDLPEATLDVGLEGLETRLPQFVVSALLLQLNKVHDERDDGGEVPAHSLAGLTTATDVHVHWSTHNYINRLE